MMIKLADADVIPDDNDDFSKGSNGNKKVENDNDDHDDYSKDGGSLAETPWHQDESYWPDLPDKRALSFWSALC